MAIFPRLCRPSGKLMTKITAGVIRIIPSQKLLYSVAVEAVDPEIYEPAIRRIRDPELLYQLATGPHSTAVERLAIGQIDDEKMLRKIAVTADDDTARACVLERIDDQKTLLDLFKASSFGHTYVQKVAAARIDDPELLHQIAMHKSDGAQYGVERITDPAILKDIALNAPRVEARKLAIYRIDDVDTLIAIAKKEPDMYAGVDALKRVATILDRENRKLTEEQREMILQIMIHKPFHREQFAKSFREKSDFPYRDGMMEIYQEAVRSNPIAEENQGSGKVEPLLAELRLLDEKGELWESSHPHR